MPKSTLKILISTILILILALFIFLLIKNNMSQFRTYNTKNGIEYSLANSQNEIQGNWKISKLENTSETYSGGNLKINNNQASWQFCNSVGGKIESIKSGKLDIPQAMSTLMYCEKQLMNELDVIISDTSSTYYISKDSKTLLLENPKFNVMFEKLN